MLLASEIPIIVLVAVGGAFILLGMIGFLGLMSDTSSEGSLQAGNSGIMSEPVLKEIKMPEPPSRFKSQRITARMLLELTVDIDGRAKELHVIDATDADTVPPILEAVHNAAFIPALDKNGAPVPVRMQLPFFIGKNNRPQIKQPQRGRPIKNKQPEMDAVNV